MRKIIFSCVLILFLASCAQILTPGGGPKDIAPPKVLKYSPDSAATNFTGKKIVIHFNEYVQLTGLNDQLIISPPLNNMPDVQIVKKDLVIKLKDTLLPNTTYSISFGNSIRDITENNILDNFRYVFSTGPTIDSLKISGKVESALTLNGEKGIYVMLYNALGDSVPLKQKPYYFTKTKTDGTFQFTNLKAGKYKLFALDDKNSNYRYDNPDERIAFSNDPILLAKNIDSLNLNLFKEDPKKQSLVKSNQIAMGTFQFVYALPMKNPKISVVPSLPSTAEMISENSANGDSITVWLNNFIGDSITFQVEDSRAIVSTIKMKIGKSENKHTSKGGAGVSKESRKLQLNCNANHGAIFDLGKSLVIATNNPVKNFNAENFILTRGNDTLKTKISLSENKRYLSFDYAFEEDSTYSLFVKPGAITDFFGQKNDTLKSKFKIQESNYYGTLSIKLTGLPSGNYILDLVDEKDEIVREQKISDQTSTKFEMLPPGVYRLKLIADENKNGRWDSGNYMQHRQPEKVIYYVNPIKMRSGWDMDVEWIFK